MFDLITVGVREESMVEATCIIVKEPGSVLTLYTKLPIDEHTQVAKRQ